MFIIKFLASFHTFLSHCRQWDIELLKRINLGRCVPLDKAFMVLTDLTSPIAYGLPLILLMAGWAGKNIALKCRGLYILLSVALAGGITDLLKCIIARPRPFQTFPFIQKLTAGGSWSFPSGHACDAFALAVSMSMVFSNTFIRTAVFIWALLVGYSRIDLGVHYPSDVLAGGLIGAATAIIGYHRAKKLFKKPRFNINIR